MPDDPSKRAPQDRNLINLHEGDEVRYWTKALGVTPEQLRQAVAQAGNSAAKVREFLSKQQAA